VQDKRSRMFLLYLYHSITDLTVLDISWSECGDYLCFTDDQIFYRNNMIRVADSPQQQLQRYGFVEISQSQEAPNVWYHPYFTSWRTELRELVELPQEFWIANSGAAPSRLSDAAPANRRSWKHLLGSRGCSRTSSRASSPDRLAARSAASTESTSASPQSQRQLYTEHHQHQHQQAQCCGLVPSSSGSGSCSNSSSSSSLEAPLFTVEEVIQWCGTTGRIVPRPRGEP
jgi:hypothetical protein